MNILFVVCAAAIAVPAISSAYEKAFAATQPGTVEFKTIPERTVILAEHSDGYFDGNNRMFGQLFRYIKDNGVSMTVPVKADIDPGRMYFYVGNKDLAKDLKDTENVKVATEPEHRVLSIGVRGAYSEANFESARDTLYNQLATDKQWKKAGEAYAIYWNGPYVPGFMKRFEVHVPVEPKPTERKTGRP